jgi:hypothetical protein
VSLRVAVVWGEDGAAASKEDDEEQDQGDEHLERVQLPATGIHPVENGAADVTHRSRWYQVHAARSNRSARGACAPHA